MAQEFLLVGATASSLAQVPAPTSYGFGLQDVSAGDAGRVQDESATMYKQRFAQKRKISLSWANLSTAEVAQVMQAFNPEYVWVRYLDGLSGEYEVREFYVGDRSTALKLVAVGGATWSTLSFDIVER